MTVYVLRYFDIDMWANGGVYSTKDRAIDEGERMLRIDKVDCYAVEAFVLDDGGGGD